MIVLPKSAGPSLGTKSSALVRRLMTSRLSRPHMTSKADDLIGWKGMRTACRHADFDHRGAIADEDWRRSAVTCFYRVERVMRFGRTKLGPERYLEPRDGTVRPSPAKA